MNRHNYQKDLDRLLEDLQKSGEVPKLFLHACCAPCSSYCLEYLSNYFRITVFYYNPNIFPAEEYAHRVSELRRLVSEMDPKYPITVAEGRYDPEEFFTAVRGLEQIPEGGERCFACFRLRLEESARQAKAAGIGRFTTTLTISPLKNAEKLNEIGAALAAEYGLQWVPSDFKKKNGYKRSIELSAEHGLYRQDYCGCVFSYAERHPEAQDPEEQK